MQARRNRLRATQCQKSSHVGLWLAKYLPFQTTGGIDADEVKNAKSQHLQAVKEHEIPKGYQEAYALRRDAFLDHHQVEVACFKVNGRMVIGLGAHCALETGLTLDRTWGVPVIPGSALKGLAAATAHQLLEDQDWRKRIFDANNPAPTSHERLFGTPGQRGALIFHDAWLIPPEQTLPLYPDVMTVHHPDYYKGEDAPPSDLDSPIPISFISVGGTFLIALEGPPAATQAALDILTIGLCELGIGAKTSSGYGRLELDNNESERLHRARREQESRAKEAAAQARVASENAELPRLAPLQRWEILVARASANEQHLYDLARKLDPADHCKGIEIEGLSLSGHLDGQVDWEEEKRALATALLACPQVQTWRSSKGIALGGTKISESKVKELVIALQTLVKPDTETKDPPEWKAKLDAMDKGQLRTYAEALMAQGLSASAEELARALERVKALFGGKKAKDNDKRFFKNFADFCKK